MNLHYLGFKPKRTRLIETIDHPVMIDLDWFNTTMHQNLMILPETNMIGTLTICCIKSQIFCIASSDSPWHSMA